MSLHWNKQSPSAVLIQIPKIIREREAPEIAGEVRYRGGFMAVG